MHQALIRSGASMRVAWRRQIRPILRQRQASFLARLRDGLTSLFSDNHPKQQQRQQQQQQQQQQQRQPPPVPVFGGGVVGFLLQRVLRTAFSFLAKSIQNDQNDIKVVLKSAEAALRRDRAVTALLGGPVERMGPVTQQFSSSVSVNGREKKQIGLRASVSSAAAYATVSITASKEGGGSGTLRVDRVEIVSSSGGRVEVRNVPTLVTIDVEGR